MASRRYPYFYRWIVLSFILPGIIILTTLTSKITLNDFKTSKVEPTLSAGSPQVMGAIPWTIWQTYRSKELGVESANARDTWLEHNPQITMQLLDDFEIDSFIKHNFSSATYAAFKSYPIGVMRADFWRYAILYVHGGIYADIDTISLRPIHEWFPALTVGDDYYDQNVYRAFFGDNPQLHSVMKSHSWKTCSIVIALEYPAHFCQWVRKNYNSAALNCNRQHNAFILFVLKTYLYMNPRTIACTDNSERTPSSYLG